MPQIKFTQDYRFNLTGAEGDRVSHEEGEVVTYSDEWADWLVKTKEVARYHDMRPQETKSASPTMDWLKSNIQDHLDEHGIDYNDSDTKQELLDKIG